MLTKDDYLNLVSLAVKQIANALACGNVDDIPKLVGLLEFLARVPVIQ